MAVLVSAPLAITLYLVKNHSKFREKAFMSKFNGITGDLNFKHKTSPVIISLFCYRRLLQTLLIVFMT
jgi:hypothetical protein